MFSKACEYALRTMIYLNSMKADNQRVGLNDIAAAIDSPVSFTAKILQQLVRAQLLLSVRGPHGGFVVVDRKISLHEIVVAIDGPSLFKNCVVGLSECSETKPCPLHHKFVDIRKSLTDELKNTVLDELNEDVLQGMSYLKV
ncbi:RrF2 family transcriptional regulator [Reichenbachiella ulvae]|uniref:Rrf2 family transcriptional regulator n=1 Tax=Reichenbachiella ulvae TaxID=2980104 RepID=A0ABT3CXA2_9BACT|nr:Rrf2 family transcriptional regulator [Reichenbachiella ulvae]MCV9388229.1 Rrf2 family transcriptional regulator [Reichenbachiella ulvae]